MILAEFIIEMNGSILIIVLYEYVFSFVLASLTFSKIHFISILLNIHQDVKLE
jgi:hypothetical protein